MCVVTRAPVRALAVALTIVCGACGRQSVNDGGGVGGVDSEQTRQRTGAAQCINPTWLVPWVFVVGNLGDANLVGASDVAAIGRADAELCGDAVVALPTPVSCRQNTRPTTTIANRIDDHLDGDAVRCRQTRR
jgi:hypothetical protein